MDKHGKLVAFVAVMLIVVLLAAWSWSDSPWIRPTGEATVESVGDDAYVPPAVESGYQAYPPARLLDTSTATMLEFKSDVLPSSPDWAFIEQEFPRNDDPNRTVSSLEVDLDADGEPETAYYVVGSASCGTSNCDLRIYKTFAEGKRLIFRAATGPMFLLLTTKTAGYFDIAFPAGLSQRADDNLYTVWRWAE